MLKLMLDALNIEQVGLGILNHALCHFHEINHDERNIFIESVAGENLVVHKETTTKSPD